MRIHGRLVVTALVSIATASGIFSGCTVGFPTPVPSTSGSASGSANPSASAGPTDDPNSDVLFTISAETSDSHGDPVTLTLVGHESQAWDASGREQIKKTFVTSCEAAGGVIDDTALGDEGATLMVIDITSAPAGRTLSGPVGVQLGSPYYYQIATGDGVSNPLDSPCSPGYQLNSSGTVSAISSFGTGSPTPDLLQWRTGRYGFSTEPPTVLANCDIHLTARALAAQVYQVDGWSIDAGTETDCAIGYQGE